MNAPTVNVPLLRKTMEHIEAHPQEWHQAMFRCGTSFCFGGWAAVLDGAEWAFPDGGTNGMAIARPDDDPEDVCDGLIHVQDRAQAVLGLTGAQAEHLFAARNTLDDLRRITADLIDGAE